MGIICRKYVDWLNDPPGVFEKGGRARWAAEIVPDQTHSLSV